uniref:Uncharacterized protein n=2 Tax=Brugia malayi TaxID=6279 RepID=A8NQF6_BRUMA
MADRMVLYRRRIYQVSALSTFDGSLCAYHGCNGEPEKRLPHPRKAAGAQITHSQNEEVVTKNNETVLFEAGYRNGYNLNLLTRIYERASLVPAAAVIPALKVYIVIAAVKKLVVGSASQDLVHPLDEN